MSTDYEKMSDRELDAMVHTRVMGREPKIIWIARADDGKPDEEAGAFVNTNGEPFVREWPYSKADVEKWITEHPVIYGEKIILGKWLKHAPYTTDPSAWWEVAEKITTKGLLFELTMNCDGCCASVSGFNYSYTSGWPTTPGRAICIAALRALDAQAGGA